MKIEDQKKLMEIGVLSLHARVKIKITEDNPTKYIVQGYKEVTCFESSNLDEIIAFLQGAAYGRN